LDDCERITGKPEVIGLSTGLLPRNALSAANVHLDEKCGCQFRNFTEASKAFGVVTLTIPANFMLIATLDKQGCGSARSPKGA
jgi:hypothetical protein